MKLSLRHVRRRFDRAAKTFGGADYVHRTSFSGLAERLAPLLIKPARILDLGSAAGSGSRQLAKIYKKSRVVSLDLSAGMLMASNSDRPMFSAIREIQANACQIPLRNESIDLVVANLLLPWIDDLGSCLSEVARVLSKGGVFAFSTLGADSMNQLRENWDSDDSYEHISTFPDMHDVGDAIVKARLADPVLDVDPLTVTFGNVTTLFRDLTACGARNCMAGRRQTLTGKNRFAAARHRFEKSVAQNGITLELELVYGHAWGVGPKLPAGEYRFEADAISRRVRP